MYTLHYYIIIYKTIYEYISRQYISFTIVLILSINIDQSQS